MRRIVLALIVTSCFTCVQAASLFGVPLATASAAQLRQALLAAGATLIPGDQIYETYDSSALLPGSSKLHLGADPSGEGIAFVEYCLNPRLQKLMQQNLTNKYGAPKVTPGRFISDTRFNWSSEAVSIQLTRAPGSPCTALSYHLAASTERLRAAQRTQELEPEIPDNAY